MNGFYIFVAIAGIISILITYALGRFFRPRAIKYIPAIILALAVLGLYTKARFFSAGTGFEDLGYIILALIAGIVFFVSLFTAIIMGLIQRKNMKNH